MTEQEERDLLELRRAIADKEHSTFLYMRVLFVATPTDLKIMGYDGKSNAEAMRLAFERCEGELKRLRAAHIKKYPD